MENALLITNGAVALAFFGVTWWYAGFTSRLLKRCQQEVDAMEQRALATAAELKLSYSQTLREIEERRQVEDKYRESEARFAAFMRHFPGSATMRDLKGRYLFANETWEKSFGLKPGEWFGKSLEDVWPADRSQHFLEMDKLWLDSRLPVENVETIQEDQTQHYWLIRRFPILNQDGQTIMVGDISLDITDRRQAEDALYQEKERYRILAEESPLGISIISKKGTYKYLNPKVVEMFGYTLADIPNGQAWFDRAFPDPQYRQRAISAWFEDLQPVRPWVARPRTFTVACKDGSEKTINFRAVTLTDGDHLVIYEDITARYLAQEALKQSEIKYRTLVEQVPAVIYIAALRESRDMLYVSPPIEAILGFSPHDFEADPQTWAGRLHAQDHDRVMAQVARSVAGAESFTCEYRMVANDGRIVWFHDEARVVRDQEGRPLFFQGVMQDISARRELEGALQDSEEKYRLLVNQIPAVVFKGYPDWSIDFFDQKVEALTGYTKEDFDSRRLKWCDLIPAEDLEQAQQIFVEALKSTKSYVQEHRIRKENGDYAWVQCRGQIFCDAQGKVDHVSGVTFDITEQRQAEEALRRSEEKFRLLVNTIPAVVFRGYADWSVDFFDKKVEELTGYATEDFASQRLKWSDLILPEDLPAARAVFVHALKTDHAYIREYRIRHKNGDIHWVQSRGKIICHPDGKIDYVTGVFFDITKQKEMEEALRAERNRLETVTQHMGAGLAVISKDYQILWANKVLREAYGDCEGELCYPTMRQSLDICLDCGVREVLGEGREKAVHEYQSRDPQGRPVWTELITTPVRGETGEVDAALQLEVSITERKLAEEALRESEKRYRLLAENVRDVIWTADLNLKFSYVSPSVLLLCGYTPEEAMTKQLGEVITPPSWDLASKTLVEALALESQGQPGPGKTWTLELEIICRDSSTVWTETKASFLRDEEGLPVGILGVCRDIGDRKRSELALLRREAILEAIGFAAERFLQAASWEDDIHEILAQLGQAAAASRAYIFANHPGADGATPASQRYEWVAPDITPQSDNPDLQNLPWREAGFGRWEEELSQGRLIVGQVDQFPPLEQELLATQDIKSILVVPIFVGQEWWGLVGFDECLRQRDWSPAELEALKAAASILGAAFLRERAEKALKASEEKLRSLSYRLLDAQEMERKRLAAELHDELGHALLTLKLQIESLERELGPRQVTQKKATTQILRFIGQTIEEVRRLYLDLTPGDLEDLGLTAALRGLIEDFGALRQEMTCNIDLDNLEGLFALPVQTAIYRVVQEALTNIGKHANAKHVSFAVKRDGDRVSFAIADDGEGLDAKALVAKKTLGLLAMEERVKFLGGSFELASQKAHGTRISFTIPLLPRQGSYGESLQHCAG